MEGLLLAELVKSAVKILYPTYCSPAYGTAADTFSRTDENPFGVGRCILRVRDNEVDVKADVSSGLFLGEAAIKIKRANLTSEGTNGSMLP